VPPRRRLRAAELAAVLTALASIAVGVARGAASRTPNVTWETAPLLESDAYARWSRVDRGAVQGTAACGGGSRLTTTVFSLGPFVAGVRRVSAPSLGSTWPTVLDANGDVITTTRSMVSTTRDGAFDPFRPDRSFAAYVSPDNTTWVLAVHSFVAGNEAGPRLSGPIAALHLNDTSIARERVRALVVVALSIAALVLLVTRRTRRSTPRSLRSPYRSPSEVGTAPSRDAWVGCALILSAAALCVSGVSVRRDDEVARDVRGAVWRAELRAFLESDALCRRVPSGLPQPM
jgi:hypothetical protein